MVLQPERCTAICVATNTGGLLPHLFTLIAPKADGYFLLHYYAFTNIFAFRSTVPCVARTFLPAKGGATDRPAGAAKVQKYTFAAMVT
jgi:hypothetical protein